MFNLFHNYSWLITLFSRKEDGPMKITDDQRNFNNREIFLGKNGISTDDLFIGRLKHTNNVEVVKDLGKKMFFDCDGLITNLPNVYLSFTIADCTAIYLFDPIKNVVGLLHAG